MKKLYLLIFVFTALVVASQLFAARPAAAWNFFPTRTVCSGPSANSTTCQEAKKPVTDPITGPKGILHTATLIIGYVVGIAATIALISGGLMYITARGDAGKVTTAKNTILYAIVGLVVGLLAVVIATFIADQLL